MKDFFAEAAFGFFLGFCLGMICVGLLMIFVFIPGQAWSARKEAIDAGVAHWEVDTKTGVRRFVYDTPKQPEAK